MSTPAANDNQSPRPARPLPRRRRLALDALSDAEVLRLALGRGRGGLSSAALGRHLLATHGGLRGVLRAGPGSLAQDVGPHLATRLLAAWELAHRARCAPPPRRMPFTSSRDIVRGWSARMVDLPDECVVALVLDVKQRLVAERVLANGTPAGVALGVREVFALAVREGGASMVLVHNHPSGDPTPSPEDAEFTRRVAEVGAAIELPLLDHVILGRDGAFSFLDAGLLKSSG
ncbi:MAG: JAB domain-containing protein [Myxococcales bacterium]|nr:JAB domain-containing protein [Myxococcales bacterium]